MRNRKGIGANSLWIEHPFEFKKANIAKQIKFALNESLSRYGDVFVMVRVGDYPPLNKKEKLDIGIPVVVGLSNVRPVSIQLVLRDDIKQRGYLE